MRCDGSNSCNFEVPILNPSKVRRRTHLQRTTPSHGRSSIMRFLRYAVLALGTLSASAAFAHARPFTLNPPPIVAAPDPSVTAQQMYLQNQSARQSTLQENAISQQQIQNLTR